jgi:cell surface protein SprA
MHYDHTVNLTYQLPFDKFPLTDWVSSNITYGAGYQWDRSPIGQDTLGNTIQNSQTISLNGQFNFVNLYNKIPYLKRINDKARGKGGKKPAPPAKKDAGKEGDKSAEKKDPKDKGDATTKKIDPLEGLCRVLMAVRTGNITYSQNSGMLLPGYGRGTNILGMDPGFDAPGWGFILGQQNRDLGGDPVRDFARYASDNDWLVRNRSIFNPYTNTRTETINGRMSLEPFKGFRVELMANRTISDNFRSFYRWDTLDTWVNDSPQEYGNFSVSTITWGTSFQVDDDNFVSPVFQQMLDNRAVISQRLGVLDPLSDPPEPDSLYWLGYGGTNQDVVIPAFIAAYTGKSADKVTLNPLKQAPLPNWDITYDGLTKLDLFKKFFRTFTLNHSYRSNFSIGNYQNNLLYSPDTTDVNGNFLPKRVITVVTISEQMRPFINFDATLQNSLLAKFEYNRDRNLSMSLTNYQLTEVRGQEFVIGSGYRFKGVKFPIEIGGKAPKSDLNLRVDLSWRRNNTVIRKMEEGTNQVTAGQDILSIKTSADYVIDQRLNVRAFYERVINNPVISTSFPSANTNLGISLRFTLAQ